MIIGQAVTSNTTCLKERGWQISAESPLNEEEERHQHKLFSLFWWHGKGDERGEEPLDLSTAGNLQAQQAKELEQRSGQARDEMQRFAPSYLLCKPLVKRVSFLLLHL